GDRLRHCPAMSALPAHAADDVLSEPDPHFFVVVELRMVLEVDQRGGACLCVEIGIELEPETESRVPIALRAEQRPRLRDREVDVEEDCGEVQTPVGHW